MNKNLLTLLGSSSSLATLLLASHSAQALMPSKMPGAIVPIPTVNITHTDSQPDFPQESQVLNSMVKQYAQTKFGCTCVNCMNLARQILQQNGSVPN